MPVHDLQNSEPISHCVASAIGDKGKQIKNTAHRSAVNKNNSVTVSGRSGYETLRHPLSVRWFSLAPIDAFPLSRPISSSYFLHHRCGVFVSALHSTVQSRRCFACILQRPLNQVKCFLANDSERKPRLYMELMQAALTSQHNEIFRAPSAQCELSNKAVKMTSVIARSLKRNWWEKTFTYFRGLNRRVRIDVNWDKQKREGVNEVENRRMLGVDVKSCSETFSSENVSTPTRESDISHSFANKSNSSLIETFVATRSIWIASDF